MKRLLLLFFMTVGIIAQVPAQFRQVEGDPIDYSRLQMPREQGSYPVTYTMYHEETQIRIPITFYGELIRTREINTKVREKAIQTALDRQGINRQQIAKWNEQVAQAKETNYSTEQFLDDIGKMSGYGNIADVIAMLGGVKDPKGWLKNQVEQQTSRESLIKELLSQIDAVGEAISGLDKIQAFLDKIDVLKNARERDKQKWANRIASYAAEGLAAFYKEANIALRQFAHGEDVRWIIRVQGKGVAPFKYEEVMCSQEWTLNMVLDKVRDPEAEEKETMDDDTFFNTFVGSYYGWLEAEAVYDLSNYSASYFVDDIMKLYALFQYNKIRGYGSHWKLNSSQISGSSWTESHKPSKVATSFALPVKISIKQSRKSQSYIYGDMKVYMGDEQWPSGEAPQPQIKTKMEIDHGFKYTLNNPEMGKFMYSGREWVAGGYRYEEIKSDYNTTAPNIEGKLGQVFEGGGFIFNMLGTEGDYRDSTRVDNTSFAGSPNGLLQVNLRQSLADRETW